MMAPLFRFVRATAIALVLVCAPVAGAAERKALTFNVLLQRSVALTAQYWNPILLYASGKSGVPLELRLAKTVAEGNTLAEQGAYDFLYTNHFFTPERARLGYRVIARPAGRGIRGQIVVSTDSPIRQLRDLDGARVAFPSRDAFASYWLPMDALAKSRIRVTPVFTSNQEAGLAQLQVGTVSAAAVNDKLAERYARREGLQYRLLWSSEVYNGLAVMAGPNVPRETAGAVARALVGMTEDPAGRKVLQSGAELLRITDKVGFVAASNADYENYRLFYRNTAVRAAD